MTITVEKFDYNKFQTEKVQFAIDLDREVFNVSEGTNSPYVDDELSMSPLWRGKYSVTEYRQILWQQIQHHLPRYLSKGLKSFYEPYLVPNSDIFRAIMELAEAYRDNGRLKLIYITDRSHAELIARCANYLAHLI
ncbi:MULTISPECIES: hypothetical protein [unclassified Microcoleus]|uniref:hypothetical protein n=1 Tax=unclassified Microcoleus TaxID=2642155 RepID=UPI002FD09F58